MNFRSLKIVILALFASLSTSYGQSVGSVDGVFNVSDMGAANYSIPIKVPDGINGLKPNISINYSSQSGNGPLGMGWSISGLSAITRTGNTIYHDKKVQSPNLTLEDKFSLDGNRLILTSGAYGVAGSLYHTEIESFREITATGTSGNGPLSFTVKDQEGLTYEYGGAGFCVASTGNTPYTWLLRKVSDLSGNSISFSYNIVDGGAYPVYISYNENTLVGDVAKSFVRFSYSSVPNPSFGYIVGGKVSASRRLDKVNVGQIVNGAEKIFKSYTMEYLQDFYTHLIKITESGLDQAESFKPTEFEYGSATLSKCFYLNEFQTSDPKVEYATGDFNGDGKTDVIQYSGQASGGNFKLFIKNAKPVEPAPGNSPQFDLVQNGILKSDPTISSNFNALKDQTDIRPFDFNGDGYDDFVYTQMQNYKKCKCSDVKQAFYIYTSNGNSLESLNRKIVSTVSPNSNDGFGNLLPLTGDFDGDGKSEILLVGASEKINSTTYTYRSYLIGKEYLVEGTTPFTSSIPNEPVYVAKGFNLPFASNNDQGGASPNDIYSKPRLFVVDYNGDGKNEVLVIRKDANNNSSAKTYALNVTYDANNKPVIGSPSFIEINSAGYPTVWHNVMTGDFNGDRITDVFTSYVNSSQTVVWEVGYGKGNGLFEGMAGPTLIYNPYYNGYKDTIRPIVIADFSGDGKDDIFDYMFSQSYGTFPPKIFQSKGNNVFNDENVFPTNIAYWSSLATFAQDYLLGDFNGDGSVDLFSKLSGTASIAPTITTFHPEETKHLISQVKNGLGALTKFQYKSLTDPSFSGAGSASYPYLAKKIPIKVVQRSIEDNGLLAAGNNTLYNYSGLKFHAQGKGILGFDQVSSFNETTGMRTSKIFGLMTNCAYRYLANTYVNYNPGLQINTPISSSSTIYSIFNYGNNRIFPYVVSTQNKNELTGEVSVTTNNYSFYTPIYNLDAGSPGSNYSGKPVSITVDKGNGLEVTTQTFKYPYRIPTNIQVYSGEPYSPYNYINSKPYKVVTTSSRVGQPAYTREAMFNYHPNYGYLTSIIADPGTSNTVTTSFWYDYYGNPLRKLKTAAGLPDIDDRMAYDASHRYVTESYNAAFPNIKAKATFDPLSGLKLTDIDPDGFATSYTYDAFGRVKTQSDNNGGLVTTSYNWGYLPPNSITPYVPEAVYYVANISNTGELNYTKYDRLGRELCSSTKSFQSKWVSTKKWYNNSGQVAGSTRPAFSDNTAPPVTTYTYDAYGRLIQTNAPEGNTTVSYGAPSAGGYTVTQKNVAANQESKVKTDFSSRKSEETDAKGNVMSYTYHSNGEVKTVAALGTTLQNYVYDNFGRLTGRQDPNYGSYIYTYNAYGQKIREKDPKGNDFGYKYDALERMFQKTGPEGNYDYTFENNAGPNCGKMTMLAGNSGKNVYSYGLGDKVNSIDYLDFNASLNFTGVASFPLSALMGYDVLGRLSWKQYPTGAKVLYSYSPVNGDLIKISDYNSGAIYFSKEDENDFGQTTAYSQNLGGGTTVNTKRTYDWRGILTGQSATNTGASAAVLQNIKYQFDPATGNLLSRKDVIRNLEELFTYDKLNRLTSIASPVGNQSFDFEPNGNISKKSDAGNFSYDPANRLTKIQPFVNIPTTTQEETYTCFNKVSHILEDNLETGFLYGANEERNTMYSFVDGEVVGFKSYAPDMEREFGTAHGDRTRTYIRDPEGNIVAIIAKENGVNKNYVVLTDHLGSFTHIVDVNGAIVEEKSYDAWGRLRNPQNWNPYAANLALGQPSYLFDRGYTGHEHLAGYGIINMNGRLYDPLMGRMFSADPYVNGEQGLQGWNRYTYAYNNPLRYTDPDGNYAGVDDLVACGLGGFFNLLSNWSNISNVGQGISYFAVGALAGEASLYGGPVAGGAVLGFGNSAVTQYYAGGWSNINWGSAIYSSAFSAVTSVVASGASNAVSPLVSHITNGIASPVIKKSIENAITGTAVGFTLGGTAGLIGGSKDPFNDALNGAWMGAGSGLINGSIEGYKAAKSAGIDPWTGSFFSAEIKNIPNNGRLGNFRTRMQIADIVAELERRGYEIEGGGGLLKEEYLEPLGGGRKGGSYLDITAKHPDYPTLRINTVDVYKSGLPTARELSNANRIRMQIKPGQHLLLIPKN